MMVSYDGLEPDLVLAPLRRLRGDAEIILHMCRGDFVGPLIHRVVGRNPGPLAAAPPTPNPGEL